MQYLKPYRTILPVMGAIESGRGRRRHAGDAIGHHAEETMGGCPSIVDEGLSNGRHSLRESVCARGIRFGCTAGFVCRYITTCGLSSGLDLQYNKPYKMPYRRRLVVRAISGAAAVRQRFRGQEGGMERTHSFGYWLRRRRKALDLTQAELARRVSCSLELIQKIEVDARRPSRQLAEKLAESLGIDASERVVFIQAARAERTVDQLALLKQPAEPPVVSLPQGTITFLFTDIEGSTQLWAQYPKAMPATLARHTVLLNEIVAANGGVVFKTISDSVLAAFAQAPGALAAALAAQRAISMEAWELPEPPRVRMALHSGSAEVRARDYFGPALNRVARLLLVGHGGQVLLSLATEQLVREQLPPDVALRDLGTHRLKDLSLPEQIFQLLAPDLRATFPALNTLDARRINLPAQPTALIGREHEVVAIATLLRRSNARLVTLTGPGGVGKTRLSFQVAAELLDDFAQGVYFVDLAPIREPSLVTGAIAATLGVRESGEQPLLAALKDYLRDKCMLLLLDNFEHLLDAAPLVAELLATAPQLKIMVTSREILRLRGEKDMVVRPLALPDPGHLPALEQLSQYAAVALFIERAIDARPDFTLTNTNAHAIAEICVRLDGLPLAIELAATWVRVVSCADIVQEIERNIDSMTTSLRDVPERHRSLHAVFEHSWNLLSEEEKRTFRRLSVFPRSFERDAAAQVAGASLLLLARLADKSLLSRNAAKRYEMHEFIRQCAHDRLLEAGEQAAAQRLHAHFFLTFAETAEAQLRGAEQQAWLSRMEAEHDNLRAALTWSLDVAGDPQIGLRLAGALWWAWYRRGYVSEARYWTARALAQNESLGATAERAKALNGAGYLAICQGDFTTARALYEESLVIGCTLDDRQAMAWAHYGMGGVSWFTGDPAGATARYEKSYQLFQGALDLWGQGWALAKLAEATWHQDDIQHAITYYEESLRLFRELGDIWSTATVLSMASMFAHRRDHAQAVALYQEGLSLCRKLGDKRGIANVLLSMATTAWLQGDYRQAHSLLDEALELYRDLGERRGIAEVLHRLSNVARDRGHLDRAVTLLEESLSLLRELGDTGRIAWALNGLGDAALNLGNSGWADSLYQESLALFQGLGDNWGRTVVLRNLGRVALSRNDQACAGALLEESLALARHLSFQQAIAWALTGLGQVAAGQGHVPRAIALYRESLVLYQNMAEMPGIAWCLEGLAGVAGVVGQAEHAARLFGAAAALRDAIEMPVPPGEWTGYDRDVATAQAQLDAEAWAILWNAGRAIAIENAIAQALDAPLDGQLGTAAGYAAPHVSSNLPVPPTTLIGRE